MSEVAEPVIESTCNRVLRLLKDVECPPFEFAVTQMGFLQDDVVLQARLYRPDSVTGAMGWGYGADYLVAPDAPDDVVIKKAFVACRDFAEHEVREAFRWKGKQVLGPHVPLGMLWEIL